MQLISTSSEVPDDEQFLKSLSATERGIEKQKRRKVKEEKLKVFKAQIEPYLLHADVTYDLFWNDEKKGRWQGCNVRVVKLLSELSEP